MANNDKYTPPFYLKNPMLQTFIQSSKLRNLGKNEMQESAEEVIIDCSDDVRLQGFLSQQRDGSSKGLVILLHGWEGSANSAYILNTGKFFFRNNYDVFRLNLRDHGESHHLNKGVFLGTLIDETFAAVKSIAKSAVDLPVFLMGFSMGGNFTIRIAERCIKDPIKNLKHTICINPPLDPMKATQRIDEHSLIRKYFLKKWQRSLIIKQKLFPELYNFSDILKMDNCMDMTEVLIGRHTDYGSAKNYFGKYTLKDGYLNRINIPVTIISSDDDPVISAEDFYSAIMNKNINLMMQSHGGHCGYIDGLRLTSWYQKRVLEILDKEI